MWYLVAFLLLTIIVLVLCLVISLGKNKRAELEGIENKIKDAENQLMLINTDLVRSKKQLTEAEEAIQEYLDSMENQLNEVDTDLINRLKSKFRK